MTLDGNKDFGNGIATRVAVMGHMNEKAGQSDGAEYKRAGIAPSITFGLDTYSCNFKLLLFKIG